MGRYRRRNFAPVYKKKQLGEGDPKNGYVASEVPDCIYCIATRTRITNDWLRFNEIEDEKREWFRAPLAMQYRRGKQKKKKKALRPIDGRRYQERFALVRVIKGCIIYQTQIEHTKRAPSIAIGRPRGKRPGPIKRLRHHRIVFKAL